MKWAHEKHVRTYALPDYPGYSRDRECDKALVKDLHQMMNDADLIIAHNGDAFDIKKSNARFLVHGLSPPSPFKTVDTLKAARRRFKFGSNKLNDLGVALGLGKKLPHTGAQLWFGCMAGDPKCWAVMRKYNAQDVRLLEKVYYRIRPWIDNHPNMTVYEGGDGCPTCRSSKIQRRGFLVKLNTKRQRWHCQSCSAWFSGEKL